MRRMGMVVLAAASLALALAVVVAFGAGGSDIASAPLVVPGQQNSGNTSTEGKIFSNPASFWKLSLIAGDRVTIDWEDTGEGTFVTQFDVFPPGTTDFNINNARHTYFQIGSNGKQESYFTANATGVFPLVFLCFCEGPGGPFDFVAYVRHVTHASLTGPPVVQAHHKITLKGQVTGLSSGKVAIQSRTKTAWKTLTLMPVKPNGTFVFTTRVGDAGTYRVRVVYFGDASHLPTSAIYSFKVI